MIADEDEDGEHRHEDGVDERQALPGHVHEDADDQARPSAA